MYCMRKDKKEKEVVRNSNIYKLLIMTESSKVHRYKVSVLLSCTHSCVAILC